ncbi:DMT family transporter [Tissierella praeacuta]|uniref:DMT family transporter n=1 Tax=Tissierella praeacuta TaxID=43131 RepID=UPI003519B8ED
MYVLLSALSFAASSSFGKMVTMNSSMSGMVNSFSRFLLGTIVMFIYIVITKKSFKPNRFKHIFIRSAFNSISIMLFSLGFQYTTITNANMLQMTYPVFVLILAPIIYKDKIKKSSYLYLGTIMLGCYLVAFPDFSSINIGDIYSILSSIAAAISILSLKEAGKYDESHTIIFYVMLLATIINFPFVIKDLAMPDTKVLLDIILSAVTGVLGQVFITMGYKYVDNATGAIVSASRILIAAILGIVLFSDPLNSRVVFGGIVIILALIGISGYFDRYKKTNV